MSVPENPEDLSSTVTAPLLHTTLPTLFQNTSPPLTLLTQGAEALVFRTSYLHPDTPCALKYRPSKSYRHPVLDARLTRHRILSEARVLVKCRREGVNVPAVYASDWEKGWLMIEWIQGRTVRAVLDDWAKQGAKETPAIHDLMRNVGQCVGRLHGTLVVHGDLTTSNLMLQQIEGHDEKEQEKELEGHVILIDFGLAAQNIQEEDMAVDLYVLERAFGSTHPKAENLFQEVLKAYADTHRTAKLVLKRLDDVRLRGRKKSMLG